MNSQFLNGLLIQHRKLSKNDLLYHIFNCPDCLIT